MRLLFAKENCDSYESVVASAEPSAVACDNHVWHTMFSSLSVSLNLKPVALHDTN